MSNLTIWLQQYKAVKGKEYTHTSMGSPAGSYNIPSDQKNQLIDLLYQTIFVNKKPVHLTEKPPQHTQIKADFDFKYQLDLIERKFTQNDIINIVGLYSDAIKHYLDVDDEKLNAYVFLRDLPYKDTNYTKDGIHLMYPDIICDTKIQHLIRKYVIEHGESIFASLECENTIEDIVDKSIISTNNWLMYGCSKPGKNPYQLKYIYDHNLCQIQVEFENEKQMIAKFSIRDHDTSQSINIKTIFETCLTPSIMFKKNIVNHRQETTQKNSQKFNPSPVPLDFEQLHKLVDLFTVKRATDYQSWRNVGLALHNIDPKSLELFNLWISFSKKSEKFNEAKCTQFWNSFTTKSNGLHIGSLYRWVKEDNFAGYEKIIKDSVGQLIITTLNPHTTSDCARIMHEMFKCEFVCASIKNNVWYQFVNHKWVQTDQGINLQNKIADEFVNEYYAVLANIKNKMNHETDQSMIDKYSQQSESLKKVIAKIKDYSYKKKIMGECLGLFYDPSFEMKLDSMSHLIGFENGVYDLNLAEFRPGRPDDFVTLTTGNDYIEFDAQDPIIMEIFYFFNQLFPNLTASDELSELCEYVLTLLSSFLEGNNPEETFNIWTGVGGNGKSKLICLLKKTLGKYCKEIPVTVFTKPRPSANVADPCVASLRGLRLCTTGEPDDVDGKSTLGMGIIKSWTGGDEISCRPLYRDQFEFKPQFKIVFCCNEMPTLSGSNDCKGKWRRIKVTPFKSLFIDNPNPNNPLEFQKDRHLETKLLLWKEAFMFILIDYYKKYKRDGLPDTFCIEEATQSYKKSLDDVQDFIDDNFEYKKGYYITFTEVWSQYKSDKDYFTIKSMKVFKERIVNKMDGGKNKPYLPEEYFVNSGNSQPDNLRVNNTCVFVDWYFKSKE